MLQVTAGVAVQYLGYTPGLFIVGLFAILILWMYANFLITGLLLIVGGMMLLLLFGFLDMFSFSDHKRREDMPIVLPSFVLYTLHYQNCEAHRKITILRVFASKPCWISFLLHDYLGWAHFQFFMLLDSCNQFRLVLICILSRIIWSVIQFLSYKLSSSLLGRIFTFYYLKIRATVSSYRLSLFPPILGRILSLTSLIQ